jgi:hypothetical protein
MESIIGVVGIQIVILVVVFIIVLIILIGQVIGVVQIILVLFLKSFFIDLFAELTDDVFLLKSVTDCQSRTPTCGFLNPLLGLIITGGEFMEAGAFSTRVGSIGKFAN